MDLKDLLKVVRRGKLVLTILPLVAMITSAIISWYFVAPIYEANTTLIVGKSQTDRGLSTDYAQLLANRQLVKTYREIAKSRLVSAQIIEAANINLSPAEVNAMIEVDLVEETELIRITVTDTNPKRAAKIANTAAEVFMAEIVKIIQVENIMVVEPAYLLKTPVRPNKKLNVVMAGVIGVIIGLGFVVVKEYLDTTINSSEDIESYLKIPTLGSIPTIKNKEEPADV